MSKSQEGDPEKGEEEKKRKEEEDREKRSRDENWREKEFTFVLVGWVYSMMMALRMQFH